MKSVINTICIIVLLVVLSETKWSLDVLPDKADSVCVIYESSDDIPEPYVTGALNKLAAEGIQTRFFDKDIVNGENDVPATLKDAISAANKNGLPALVILSSGKVIKVIGLPKTENEILEAAK
tara:strand:- start:220 stop:588 length:369 start_codon:yes stop_codon:yes gene_type:complete